MFRIPSRTIVITSILFVLTAIAVSTNLVSPSVLGLSAGANDFTVNGESGGSAAEPRAVTTPLNAITTFDAALIARYVVALPPPFNADQLTVAKVAGNTF